MANTTPLVEKLVGDLEIDDQVDLESCPYLHDHTSAMLEFAMVTNVEVDSGRVLISYEGIDSIGYDPTQRLRVVGCYPLTNVTQPSNHVELNMGKKRNLRRIGQAIKPTPIIPPLADGPLHDVIEKTQAKWKKEQLRKRCDEAWNRHHQGMMDRVRTHVLGYFVAPTFVLVDRRIRLLTECVNNSDTCISFGVNNSPYWIIVTRVNMAFDLTPIGQYMRRRDNSDNDTFGPDDGMDVVIDRWFRPLVVEVAWEAANEMAGYSCDRIRSTLETINKAIGKKKDFIPGTNQEKITEDDLRQFMLRVTGSDTIG